MLDFYWGTQRKKGLSYWRQQTLVISSWEQKSWKCSHGKLLLRSSWVDWVELQAKLRASHLCSASKKSGVKVIYQKGGKDSMTPLSPSSREVFEIPPPPPKNKCILHHNLFVVLNLLEIHLWQASAFYLSCCFYLVVSQPVWFFCSMLSSPVSILHWTSAK